MTGTAALDEAIEQVRGWMSGPRSVVVLTGAGISTDSGIPDFRGPNGVWTKNPKAERTSHIEHYLADPEVRRISWQQRLAHPAWQARPSAGHLALVQLERDGRLHTLVTQNIDGLHQAAGSDPDLVVEVHGTMREVLCMTCGDRNPMEVALARVRAGEDDPACLLCGGVLKSATVSFGQSLDPADLERAFAAAAQAQVLLCVGTTLTVYPIAGMPEATAAAGGLVVTLNEQQTAYDQVADAVLQGQIAEILPRLVT